MCGGPRLVIVVNGAIGVKPQENFDINYYSVIRIIYRLPESRIMGTKSLNGAPPTAIAYDSTINGHAASTQC